jgi:hypothetical protein
MSDIGPGDLVVCVDAVPNKCVGSRGNLAIRRNSLYRVQRILQDGVGDWGILLVGEVPHTCDCCSGSAGWRPERFRKIDAADEQFTRAVRACKPCKELIG